MIRFLLFLTTIIAATGALNTGIAQDTGVEQVPARYAVELIVFRYRDASRNTPEIPAAASFIGASPLDLSMDLLPQQSRDNAASENANESQGRTSSRPARPDFEPLKRESFELKSHYEKLTRLDAYQPLLHFGWTQTAPDLEGAYAFPVDNATRSRPKDITGSITLYKERFVHLVLDLELATPDAYPEEQERVYDQLDQTYDNSSIVARVPATHKLKESRRIRGSNAQYFDHPQFGVIAKIRKIKTAVDEVTETG